MADNTFVDELRRDLINRGLTFLGCADLSSLPPDQRSDMPIGICLGRSLDPGIIREIARGPTREYSQLYQIANRLLDQCADRCAILLQDRGYRALPFRASRYIKTDGSLSTTLPHKTVATLAGVGWIGKCALLITEEFGSAVRYNTVLTDAPLPTGTPVTESRCGDCTACISACPAHAPLGRSWWPGRPRHDFYDAHACRSMARSLAERVSIEHPICGICIAACPYTRRFLKDAAEESL